MYYEAGIYLGKEIFGRINDADNITSLVQNIGRNISLGMHINLKHSQIQLKRRHQMFPR